MANPAFRSSGAIVNVPAFGNGTINVPVPAGTVEDDILLLFNVADGGQNVFAPGSGWSPVAVINNGAFDTDFDVYSRVAGASEPANYAVGNATPSPSLSRAFMMAVSGASTTTPIDVTPVLSTVQVPGSSPWPINSPSISAATAETLLVMLVVENALRSRSFAATGSLVERQERSTAPSFAVYTEPIAAAGAVSTRTAQASDSGDYWALAILVRASGAGVTPPTISTDPTAQTVTAPSAATFTAAVTGTYTGLRWQRQAAGAGAWADVVGGTGGTTTSYTTGATALSGGSHNNGDTYRCVVTGDTSPPATSSAATLTVLPPLATTFTFTIDGAVSLTGLKFAVFEHVTPDLWVAPIVKGTNETTDGSGVCAIPVTGLTARRVGELGSAIVTNSDGTATGGSQAATRRATYYVGAFS